MPDVRISLRPTTIALLLREPAPPRAPAPSTTAGPGSELAAMVSRLRALFAPETR